jgi:hypothetical protein
MLDFRPEVGVRLRGAVLLRPRQQGQWQAFSHRLRRLRPQARVWLAFMAVWLEAYREELWGAHPQDD